MADTVYETISSTHMIRPYRYMNQVMGMNKLDANVCIQKPEVRDEHTSEPWSTPFHPTPTGSSEETTTPNPRTVIITQKILHIENKVWGELQDEYSKLVSDKYKIQDRLCHALFTQNQYTSLGSYLQYLHTCTETKFKPDEIISHISGVVGMCYHINNKLFRSGNQKSVYTTELCLSYYRVLKRGLLLTVV